MDSRAGRLLSTKILISYTRQQEGVAKHKGGRLHVAKIDDSLPLSTLADDDVINAAFAGTVVGREFLLSTQATWALRDNTAGEGPITVGIAHSNYTAAQIEEAIESTGSWDRGNQLSNEFAARKVRIVGSFAGEAVGEVLNDGKPIKTICKWMTEAGDGLQLWAYNESGGPLTTGGVVEISGKAFLRLA